MNSDFVLLVMLLHLSQTTVTYCNPFDHTNVLRSGENGNNIGRLNDNISHHGNVNGQRPLFDFFNQRVSDKNNMCPKSNMILFLLTGNIEFLKDCSSNSKESVGTAATKNNDLEAGNLEANSYSGKLLKRILHNLNEGTVKVNLVPKNVGDPEKRSRLSLNGALSSLADMLYYGEGRRKPENALHRDLLRMG